MVGILRVLGHGSHIATRSIPSDEEAGVSSFFQRLGERAVQRSKKRDLLVEVLRPRSKYLFLCARIIVRTKIDVDKTINRFEIIFGLAHPRPSAMPGYFEKGLDSLRYQLPGLVIDLMRLYPPQSIEPRRMEA